MLNQRVVGICLASSILGQLSLADVIHVPGDYVTIQEAVDAALDGDEIIVGPGIHTGIGENVIDMLGKAVWLHSSDGPAKTFIDGEGARRGIRCSSGESEKTIIEGFIIQHGSADNGGGMSCTGSSPTIENCSFMENASSGNGGGMHNDWVSSPALIDCIFLNNAASDDGGGMYNWNSCNPTLTGCTFEDNMASHYGGGICNYGSSPVLVDCSFTDNAALYEGGGMSNYDDSCPVFEDCIFTENAAFIDDGGAMFNDDSSTPPLAGTRVCGNSPDQIDGLWTDAGDNCIAESCTACMGCPGDLSLDGDVGFNDLLLLLSAWGACPDCLEDLDDSGDVGFDDLLLVLAVWGPCPG